MYIDDTVLIGQNKRQMELLQQQYIQVFSALGLPPKSSQIIEPTLDGVDCLGLQLTGKQRTFGLSASKICNLINSTQAILDRGCVSGSELSSLLGKWVWAALVCRPALAIFGASYKFIAVANNREFEIWPSVRAELQAIIDIAPLLTVNLSCSWSPIAVATDASSIGMGIVAYDSNSEQRWRKIVSSPWRFSEHINVWNAEPLTLL